MFSLCVIFQSFVTSNATVRGSRGEFNMMAVCVCVCVCVVNIMNLTGHFKAL